jgi:hypothetical protein
MSKLDRFITYAFSELMGFMIGVAFMRMGWLDWLWR